MSATDSCLRTSGEVEPFSPRSILRGFDSPAYGSSPCPSPGRQATGRSMLSLQIQGSQERLYSVGGAGTPTEVEVERSSITSAGSMDSMASMPSFTRSAPIDVPNTCYFKEKSMVNARAMLQKARVYYRMMAEQQAAGRTSDLQTGSGPQ